MPQDLTAPSAAPAARGLTRRELLKTGALGAAGAALAAALPAPAAATRPVRARAVILLWMDGGPSHLDTFDPKPDAPSDARGEFGAIRTSVPGLHIGELFPNMARVMDRCTVLRGLSHDEAAHDRACHLLLTGRPAEPARIQPSLGSLAAKELGARGAMPPYVALAGSRFAAGYGGAGALGPACDPLLVTDLHDTARLPAPMRVALELRREPAPVRAIYGSHTFGQSCLAARRLVEGGARFVTISMGGWDTHADNARALKGWLAPALDEGMAALIRDLEQRGLLESTLVAWMGEFGRAPKLNAIAGRDHWPAAGCALLAGAGLPRGHAVGRTDRIGAEVTDGVIHPAALAAAIRGKLGIPTAS